jgi:predicted metallo-beta-lactamase superfamily hydrolase
MTVNLEYHKGSFCVYSSVFCQEGYCSECEIYRKKLMLIEQKGRSDTLKSQKARQPVLVN